MLIHDPEKASNLIVSGIYAPTQPRDKDKFWEHLLQLNLIFDMRWCLLGYFNKLARPNEKKGVSHSLIANFKDSIHFCSRLMQKPS